MLKLFARFQKNLSADQLNSFKNYKKITTHKPVGRYQRKVSVNNRLQVKIIARKKITVYQQ